MSLSLSVCLSRELQRCLLGVSRVFQGCFEGVSRAVQGSFKDFVFRRKFQGCVKSITRLLKKLIMCFNGGSKNFQRSSKQDSKRFQEGFAEVSRVFHGCLSVTRVIERCFKEVS